MNLELLKKEIPYKWRQGPSGTMLAYIDARDVQDLLDEVVGVGNWQSDFKLIDGKLFGGIGINIEKPINYLSNPTAKDLIGYEWVWKWDCGVESNIEEEKGQVSDAFKRAGVQWGIGRFLYDIDPRVAPKNISSVKKPVDLDNLTPESFLDNGKVVRDTLGHTACVKCGKQVSKKVEEYSVSKFGKVLCMDCQKI
jgi:hypothetical protein